MRNGTNRNQVSADEPESPVKVYIPWNSREAPPADAEPDPHSGNGKPD